ncbi:Hypothetical predicted protein [Scomber scombrus]|uniref:Uncharacterized protein n=1 Tax=Scomber scombrus TaxID=13677 RepID=A0AAV1MTS8_SCOSC
MYRFDSTSCPVYVVLPGAEVTDDDCSFPGDVSLAIGSSVREFARSSCAVGATHQDTESALFQISEEEEQENDGTEESPHETAT